MNCTECEKIKNKQNLIYEDDSVIALLSNKPAGKGHVILYPKEHSPIIEKIPDETFGHMFDTANKISVMCFKAVGAEGTNILINNGITAGQKTGHASINIIPRKENDGLNMQWQTITSQDEDLTTTQLMLKEALAPKEEEIKQEVKPEEEVIIPEEENYQLKQLQRVP